MSPYEFTGIVLVVGIVWLLWNKSKKKKRAALLKGEFGSDAEMLEQKFEADIYAPSPVPKLDSSHWANELMNQVEIVSDISNTTLTKEVEEVVNKIIAIPQDFHKPGNRSHYKLVIESGYVEAHDQITKEVILEALTKQPLLIGEWVQWSEDQRISEGWFLREDNGVWQIGAFSAKDCYKETLTQYPDLKSACATFIKLDVEFTRKLVEADNIKKKKRN